MNEVKSIVHSIPMHYEPLEPTHLLLYLNDKTWEGEAGRLMADRARGARADGLGVLMVWERDEAHGACDFSRFLQTTPKDLVTPEDVHGQQVPGLYSDIAIAFAPGVHREVSIALIEQALAKRTEPIAKALADVSKHVVSDFKHVGEALRVNEAASYLQGQGLPTLHNGVNYDPSGAVFHARYLALLDAIQKSGMCQNESVVMM